MEPRPIKVHWLHNFIKFGMQFMMLSELGFALFRQNWFIAALILGIMFLTTVPTRLSRYFSVYIPPEVELLAVVFIFATLFLGEIGDYYRRFWWWDAVLHTGSGFLLGLTGFLLVYALNNEKRIGLHMQPGFVALFAFAFAIAGGALWEIFEFAMDSFFGLNMQKSGLVDTMWDLIVDTVGAATVSAMGYTYMKTGEKSFIQRWIDMFIEANPRLFQQNEAPKRDS